MDSKIKGLLLWAFVLAPLSWGIWQTCKKIVVLFS